MIHGLFSASLRFWYFLSLSLSLSPLLFICLIVEKSCNLKTSIQFKRFFIFLFIRFRWAIKWEICEIFLIGVEFDVVIVGNIPYDATEEQLIEICQEVGPVVSFRSVFLFTYYLFYKTLRSDLI